MQLPGLTEVIIYLLTGAFSGTIAGLFGVGGGLIIVPVLHYALKIQGYDESHLMHISIATSLAVIVITSLSSTLAHQRKHAILWPLALVLVPGVVIGSWLGGQFASTLRNDLLTTVFSIFELLVAINLLLKKNTLHAKQINRLVTGLGGIIIGFVSAIIGIAGGTMTVPFLHWFNISMRNAVATSAAVGFPIALSGALSYIVSGWDFTALDRNGNDIFMLGYVQPTALAIIALSSFIFAPVGAGLAHSIDEKKLRISFACLLCCLGVTMFISA